MTAKRPVCVLCGKAYGRRRTASEQVRWPVGEEMPPYRGNGVITKMHPPYRTLNNNMVATRWIWDGETWIGGYNPFCTLRCALAYARFWYRKSKAKGVAADAKERTDGDREAQYRTRQSGIAGGDSSRRETK